MVQTKQLSHKHGGFVSIPPEYKPHPPPHPDAKSPAPPLWRMADEQSESYEIDSAVMTEEDQGQYPRWGLGLASQQGSVVVHRTMTR